MSDLTPEQEIEMGTPRSDPDREVRVRPLRSDEDGAMCLGCAHPIRFRSFESRRPAKQVAVLPGGALCCSQMCVEVELARRDDENQHEEDQAVRWAEDMGYLDDIKGGS